MQRPVIRFHISTESSWSAMLDAIRQAQHSIDLEQYIFTNDTIGSEFLSAVIKRAQEGVKVRLLFDMVGSLSFYVSDLPDELQKKGIKVSFFNSISFWRIGNITSHFFRDHRKMLVVDGNVGFIGGVGIADYMSSWRDTMVEVQGEFVKNILYTFDLVWRRATTGRYKRFKRAPYFHKDFEILINSPRFRQRFLYYTYLSNIRNAQHSILLATPYFVPDNRFLRALRVAAYRGVDVRLIVPASSDVYFGSHVQSWYIGRALKSGIKVYRYKGEFYHTKMAVIDGAWATVGSSNLDNLSFIFNHEANIASSDTAFIDSVKHHFERDFSHCEEVTHEQWKKRGFLRKTIEFLSWPFHKIA